MTMRGKLELLDYGDDTGFYHYPLFGLGCDCVHWEIWGYKHSEN